MRKMERLNRGLIAARLEKGMYLSWRFLGNEPDGICWRIYRRRGEGGLGASDGAPSPGRGAGKPVC